MDNPESRIAHSPEAESDDFASPPHPQTSDAPDRLSFEPVPLRYREDGLTREKQRAYVEALADCGVAREAAARVDLTEQSINRVRRRADARSFDLACEAAHRFGARRLRSVAFDRAVEGTLKGHYYHGELVSEERVYDNRLLIYLLGKTEHLLEPSKESLAICEDWERHMDELERGPPPPEPETGEAAQDDETQCTGYEVREDEDGIWWTSFPPPAGFDGEERGEFFGDGYERTLSAAEQAMVDAAVEEEEAEYLATESASRDRFFGFAGGTNSSRWEAEPYEPSGDEPPIETKSATPCAPVPQAAASAGSRIPAERRSRMARAPSRLPAPAPAQPDLRLCPQPGRLKPRTFPPPRAFPR